MKRWQRLRAKTACGQGLKAAAFGVLMLAVPLAAASVPYLCAPGGGELTSAGAYDGYFYHEAAFSDDAASAVSVRGTLALKITSLTGKLTAKAVVQKGLLSFSATAWTLTESDGTCRATLKTSGGETLELQVRQSRIWGTLTGGAMGSESFTLDGARNDFGGNAPTAAKDDLDYYLGYYTIALPWYEQVSSGNLYAAPLGIGYLTMTVGSGGSAKIAGVLADGTKVSQASRLIYFDDCNGWACVPFFVPLYAKQGWVGGLLWIDPETGVVFTDWELGWFVRWEKPGTGRDGFSELLDVCGGYYNKAPALQAHYRFGVSSYCAGFSYYAGGFYWDMQSTDIFNEGVAVTGAGNRQTMAKGQAPYLSGGAYTYSGENSALASLTFSSATGIFKGKFNLYYDYSLSGRLTHKAVSVPYTGVLTPVCSSAFNSFPYGAGNCLVPDNDPAVSAYRLKRSYWVTLEDAP